MIRTYFYSFKFDSKDICTNAESAHVWKNLDIKLKDVDKSTSKNLQFAIQASTGSLPFFSLPSETSILWKKSNLGKKRIDAICKYSCKELV